MRAAKERSELQQEKKEMDDRKGIDDSRKRMKWMTAERMTNSR